MGSFDGTELCKLVYYILLPNYILLSYYILLPKNTDLILQVYLEMMAFAVSIISVALNQKKKKKISLTFLKINSILTFNFKILNFLDVTLNLNSFQPYRNSGDDPLYININSNHPPNIIKLILKMISNHINNISSRQEAFDRTTPFYYNALNSCGFKDNIAFIQNIAKGKCNKVFFISKTKHFWFNPPYSLNIRTNVAKIFLGLIDMLP